MKQIVVLMIVFGLVKFISGYPVPEPTMQHLLPLVETVLALAGTATGSYYGGSLYYGGAPYYSGTPCYGQSNVAGYGTPCYGQSNVAGYGTPCYGQSSVAGYGKPCYGLQYG